MAHRSVYTIVTCVDGRPISVLRCGEIVRCCNVFFSLRYAYSIIRFHAWSSRWSRKCTDSHWFVIVFSTQGQRVGTFTASLVAGVFDARVSWIDLHARPVCLSEIYYGIKAARRVFYVSDGLIICGVIDGVAFSPRVRLYEYVRCVIDTSGNKLEHLQNSINIRRCVVEMWSHFGIVFSFQLK